MERDKWSNRSTFILAAIGSAVGLGNAWRFPGLAAKHGGGAFLLVYIVAMLVMGIPMLMAEIAIGRKVRSGAAGSMRALSKKAEPVGWIGVANGFVIEVYYACVFAWVILMFFMSFKFAGFTGNPEAASNLWAETIKTTWSTEGFGTISWPVLGCLILAWGACWWCIRNGTTSVGKVVKYTVLLPVACLVILAIRGFSMNDAMHGLSKLFIPDWSALADSTLWVDAIGQVFYSLSVAMAIMFAYGSFLRDDTNVAVDTIIIAFSDLLISVLAGVVMFTTMAGVGMLDDMSASGIATAFIIYPQAIVKLTNVPWINAAFGYVFYFCLITLAIDSLFSIVEGVSTAVSDKFGTSKKKTTATVCIISGVISLIYVTGAGFAFLDIVDYFVNAFPLIIAGILETIVIAWIFKPGKVVAEINRNTGKFKINSGYFNITMKIVAPVVLTALLVWNIVTLLSGGGLYGGYPLWANLVFGWGMVILACVSGFIVSAIANKIDAHGKGASWKD